SQRGRIVELVNAQRQVAVYGQNELVDAGGLMAYSFSVIEQYRSVATVIDKILKGANPAELPVEQPTRFELVLNLRTAKAQGVTFPPAVLLRADRLIEGSRTGGVHRPAVGQLPIASDGSAAAE